MPDLKELSDLKKDYETYTQNLKSLKINEPCINLNGVNCDQPPNPVPVSVPVPVRVPTCNDKVKDFFDTSDMRNTLNDIKPTFTKFKLEVDNFNNKKKELNSTNCVEIVKELKKIFKRITDLNFPNKVSEWNKKIDKYNNMNTECTLDHFEMCTTNFETYIKDQLNKYTKLGFGKSGRKRSGRKASKKSKDRRGSKKSNRKGHRGSKKSKQYYCKARLGRRRCGSKIMGRSKKFCKKHMGSKIARKMYSRSRKLFSQKGFK